MEEWKEIPGYERYEVSSLGRVRRGNLIRKLGWNKSGRLHICMTMNRKTITKEVHRLVALTFIPNPENKPTVDHINRDFLDNRIDNLRWATRTEQNLNKHYDFGISGHRWIIKDVIRNKWAVVVKKNNLGRFKTLPEAIAARDAFLMSSLNLQP